MRTGEVLSAISEGITKEQLYYLEARGYIKPLKVRVGKIYHRDYSEEDMKLVKAIWRYLRRGYTPRVAYEKVTGGHK